jgi:isopentenyl-diphosphate Delta-isomerase
MSQEKEVVMNRPVVVLVDESDRQVGVAEKMQAHQRGWLHRAFSVFLFQQQPGHWYCLLQQRHDDKYHCGGLWSNTCCSHPLPGEDILAAGKRRLQEELGLSADLRHGGTFIYRAECPNQLIEFEVDHVLVGHVPSDQTLALNPAEVAASRLMRLDALAQALASQPQQYTPWFKPALQLAQQALPV